MQNGNHDDGLVVHTEKDCIGKPGNQGAPGAPVYQRVAEWLLPDLDNERIHGIEKSAPKTGILMLIPAGGRCQMQGDPGPERQLPGHSVFRTSRMTSSAGRPSLPSTSNSSSSRSNSCRCEAGSDEARSLSVGRLASNVSASRRRSAAGSASSFSRSEDTVGIYPRPTPGTTVQSGEIPGGAEPAMPSFSEGWPARSLRMRSKNGRASQHLTPPPSR
jgi:hypothetical protein